MAGFRFLILTWLLVFSVSAGALSINPCALSLGGRCFSQAEKDRFESGTITAGGGIILIASNGTAGRGTSFRNKAGTDFVVGASVTLKCKAIRAGVGGSAGLASYQTFLGKSDAAVTYDTASPGTNPVYYGGASVSGLIATGNNFEASIDWDVSTGKYPFVAIGGGPAAAMVWCFID